MNTLLKLPIVFLILLPSPGYGGDRVDKTMDAEPDGAVKIEVVRGEVNVIGWDRPQVRVKGELDDLTREFIFETRGDLSRIKVRIRKPPISWGDGSDLKIYVPKTNRVSFKGISTDLEVTNVHNSLTIDNVSGEIDLTDIHKRIRINSVSGDLDLKDSSGTLRAVSVSGEMKIRLESSEVSMSNVSGDIDAELGQFTSLDASTISGEVEIAGQLSSSGNINIESVSGDIRLSLIDPIDARLSIRTGPGGDIANRMSNHEPRISFPASSRLNAKIGDGSGDIRVQTVSGEIRLERD